MWMHQSRCFPTQEILGVHNKNNRKITIEELSQSIKVPLDHMFNNDNNCSSEW